MSDISLRIQALHAELDRIQKELQSFSRPSLARGTSSGRDLVYELLMQRMGAVKAELGKLEN